MTSRKNEQKWLHQSAITKVVAFVLFLHLAPCSGVMLNCTDASQPSLLNALTSVFNQSAIRPVMSMETATNVSMYFTLYGILGVDEKAQLLMTYIWLNFWWENEFVSWDPVECGTDKVSLPRKKFWVPDIVINEFMDENKAPPVPYVYLYSNGMVNDALPVKVVSSCNLNIYTFPFDIQNCTFTFNSYLHKSRDIKMALGRPVDEITETSKAVITTMGEWELLDITFTENGKDDPNSIDELAFHIRVRRRATLYVVNLIIPSCFLITVDLFSFLLPPQSVDRSSFKMTLILGYTVFLMIMNNLLPITGNMIPLINVFFSLCLALMVTSLLETILITDLLHSSKRLRPVPRWVRILILQVFGCIVCLPWKDKDTQDADLGLTTVAANGQDLPNSSRTVGEDKGVNTDSEGEVKGPQGEDQTVEELRSLGKDLQAIRSHVDNQLQESPSSEQWVQCRQQKVSSSRVLFLFITLFLSVQCDPIMLNCTSPDPPALLQALTPVFSLNTIRPVYNLTTPTHVFIEFILFGILGVDEKAQILTTFIWQYLVWYNEFVRWDPDQCGASYITIPRKKLWVPDIVINEFMEENTAPFVPYVYLHSNGMIVDDQPVKVVSSCRLDIYLFPFDTQNCTLSFNSYIHDMGDLEISSFWSEEQRLDSSRAVMTTLGEWELVGLKVKLFNFTTYQELRFYVSVRRSPTMYIVNLLLPSCFLITVDLFSFLLPPQSVDRSLFKMTLILGYTMFLLIMNDLLPVTGNTIPLMNVFLSMCLTLMVASLLETIIITNLLCGTAHHSAVPWILRVIILQLLGPLMLLPPKPKKKEDTVIKNPATKGSQDMAPQQTVSQSRTVEALQDLGKDLRLIQEKVEHELSSSQNSQDWFQMGHITDRLIFILYILFISVSFITMVIMWAQSS